MVNVLYLSHDFLGINFEMAFQRTDYDFVCCVLLRTYLHCTALGITVWYKLFILYYEMIFMIYLNEIDMKI